MLNRSVQRLSAVSSPEERALHRRVVVYDCRYENKQAVSKMHETIGMDFNKFLQLLRKEYAIPASEIFVLATTDRKSLDYDTFLELQDSSTLYLLKHEGQALSGATEEIIKFTPHYDTLIKSGMFEYYASESKNSLAYALAELIDNSLSATAKNTGVRTIEIRMLFDETVGKPAVIVLDNGCGMTSQKLNNWAVYRLSKFTRHNGTFESEEEKGYVRPDPVPRSLNSDISYFGVGGKQAAFFIGNSTRMISKPRGSPDVHELLLSKEEFERKEKNNEEMYSGTIRNRMPSDSSHVTRDDERFLHALIAEESGKDGFTAVVITGIQPGHITFLKEDFKVWTTQLAQVYHFYIHGVNGNILSSSYTNSSEVPKIDIQISLREKPPRIPRMMNLREIDDDVQTAYINSAADTFEFKATVREGGTVEGIIRYHPFLYDKETYPQDPEAVHAPVEDDADDDNESGVVQRARGTRPIFDCFWNGRLIPNTQVSEFDWCTYSKTAKVPQECYSRISGALFTDDSFQVTTSKLTFMELEPKLKNKDTIFTLVVNGQKMRSNMPNDFKKWLQNCHVKYDKQVKFLGYKETITRPDMPKKLQHPWATFTSIEWDGKVYKTGQLVKSQKTVPILYGIVVRFLLYGDYKKDGFANGGMVEVALEPRGLHDKTKTIAISKIDKMATTEAIQKNIDNDSIKLPQELKVDWPDGEPWPQNAVRPAGTPLGPIKIYILNKKGEALARMPSVGQGTVKKLMVVLSLIQHGPNGDQEVVLLVAQHSPNWGYWFKKIDNLIQLGEYTLCLTTAINERNETVFGGRELPSYKLKFTIKEGNAESFLIGVMSSTLHVGVPFDIPLLIKDGYGHSVSPPPNLKPELKCSGLDLSYEKADSIGTTFTIRRVKARGKVLNYQQSETYNLKVTLPGMKIDTQSIKISILPGKPHSIHVKPEDDPITVENGNPANFNIEIHDEAGNVTANPKQIVRCQVEGLPMVATDCSSTGAVDLSTKPINLKIIKGEPQKLKVEFSMPSHPSVAMLERELEVEPSTRVSCIEVCCDDENLVLRNNEKISWLAGGVLENLFYKLYDEAGRERRVTAEMASKIKVNWTGIENLKDLVQGKLPDLQVPKQVQTEHYYQVSYLDQSVSKCISFHIVPIPDEPTLLKATLLQSTLKLGESLPGNIKLDLVDQYDNVTKMLTSGCVKHMTVEAEGLDKSAINIEWQERSCSVLVTGVQFKSVAPGSREICFTYKSFEERVIVKVTAGEPAKLKLVGELPKSLQVLNDHRITTPFTVQVCDEWGNPCQDQKVVVDLTSSPQTLKVTANVASQLVDTKGRATFNVSKVSGQKGYYQLEFRGVFNLKPIPGPSVNLTVLPDPKKPVSLSVEYDTNAKFPAGGKFPAFSVTVLSEEGSPITTFNPAAASMYLWKWVALAKTPPKTATELKCSKPMENEKDCFHFRDKEIPEEVGKHSIQFSLRLDKTNMLFSDQIIVHVVANQPVKLAPDSQPRTPVVSFSKTISNRTLVENMTLLIMDLYGNPAGQELGGKIFVSMKNSSKEGNKTLPLFERENNSLLFSLVKGKANIKRLTIRENSPGESGSEYILVFKPEVTGVPLAPFELPFNFYNDVDNQQKMSELSRKKDELTKTIAAFENNFKLSHDLLALLTAQHLTAGTKEAEQRNRLNTSNVPIGQNVSIPEIDRLLKEKTDEAAKILKAPTRHCSVRDHFRGQTDVLGMVGHLALVQDEAAARVISWFLQGDMDCVITKTTAAAQKIVSETRGQQQVMALDSVFVSSDNRPLPHVRNGRMLFDPPGNPVYARELLIYPQDPENCEIVFKNLLANTILMDDLNSATNYRKSVVQNRTPCPTILTRQGDKVSGKGKFGGAQNRAPPINSLKVFGAPRPPQYYTVQEQIDLLRQYHLALAKSDKANKDREKHLKTMHSPEMKQQRDEMEEKKKQLEEIQRQLVSTTARPGKRGAEGDGQPSDMVTKRQKQRSY